MMLGINLFPLHLDSGCPICLFPRYKNSLHEIHASVGLLVASIDAPHLFIADILIIFFQNNHYLYIICTPCQMHIFIRSKLCILYLRFYVTYLLQTAGVVSRAGCILYVQHGGRLLSRNESDCCSSPHVS